MVQKDTGGEALHGVTCLQGGFGTGILAGDAQQRAPGLIWFSQFLKVLGSAS